MSTERNKAIARQFHAAFNERNWAGCRSLLAPNCRSYQPGAASSLTNDELTAVGQLFAAAFPDLVVNVHEQVAEGNRVVTRISFAGTHRDDFQGIPATGKRIDLEGYIIDQLVDEAIVEHRAIFDTMTLLQQLGVAPASAAAEPVG